MQSESFGLTSILTKSEQNIRLFKAGSDYSCHLNMMFIHIGHDTVIIDKEIIGVFDMENTTIMKKTIDYLNNAERCKQVKNVAPYELPKSFIVCEEPDGKVIYISPVSVGTILRRIEQSKSANF